MIQSFIIQGLNNRKDSLEMIFHKGLNIFTGRNGSGKTSILKALWYTQSGLFKRLQNELDFESIECTFFPSDNDIDTPKVSSIKIIKGIPHIILKTTKDESLKFDFEDEVVSKDNGNTYDNFNIEQLRDSMQERSIFFSTFRRIEGGFGIESMIRFSDNINILEILSKRNSSRNHTFVASISTNDISQLINKEYALRSEKINNQQQDDYKKIKHLIEGNIVNKDTLREYIQKGENLRIELLKPFSVLQDTVKRFYQQKGIVLNDLTLGNVENSVESDKLSSGEKQMLSFLCYNLFSKRTSIYIDEPELSLHPDWQRQLIPTLLEQGTDNQYFLATHSPFIYAAYPEFEFTLDEDKGDNK
ncbi:MAG: ATP-binding protein [Bacteroidales bacterium]|nr:ATP-binding protein [Bacteroidales bacterium]